MRSLTRVASPNEETGYEASASAPGPGRSASSPEGFGWAAWRSVLGRIYVNLGMHHLSIVAAGVAFFGVLAIFPAIASLVALYGLIADPGDVARNLGVVRPLLPPDAYGLLETQVRSLVEVPQQRLGFASLFALLIALWSARAGVSGLMEGLNIVYREVDARSLIVQYAISLALTALLLLVAIVALLVMVALPAALQIVDFGPLGAWLTALGPLLVLAVAVVFVIGALYRYGPHRATARKRWVSWAPFWPPRCGWSLRCSFRSTSRISLTSTRPTARSARLSGCCSGSTSAPSSSCWARNSMPRWNFRPSAIPPPARRSPWASAAHMWPIMSPRSARSADDKGPTFVHRGSHRFQDGARAATTESSVACLRPMRVRITPSRFRHRASPAAGVAEMPTPALLPAASR